MSSSVGIMTFPTEWKVIKAMLVVVVVVSTPLKNIKVSWDYDIPSIWKGIKFMFQTTNQILKPVENRDPLGHDTGPPKAYAASPGQGAAGAAYSCRSLALSQVHLTMAS